MSAISHTFASLGKNTKGREACTFNIERSKLDMSSFLKVKTVFRPDHPASRSCGRNASEMSFGTEEVAKVTSASIVPLIS